MSFWSTLEADVNKGLEVVTGIVVGIESTGVVPTAIEVPVNLILSEVTAVVNAIETATGKTVTSLNSSAISSAVQAATTVAALNHAASLKGTS